MMVRVRLFAVLRERAGQDHIDLELDQGATVAAALEALGRASEIGELIARMPVLLAVNREYASPDDALSPDDELALIPPVSGGASEAVTDRIHARVSPDPLSLDALSRRVSRASAGAIVTFEGQTRDVTFLDYEAYAPMAVERMRAILGDCVERHGLEAAAAEHRVGAVPLEESSVIVAVSAAHRSEAFAGAREAIDRIKAEAPIWKKEVTVAPGGTGERWVDGSVPIGERDAGPPT